MLALTAVYTREATALGRPGLVGYLAAFFGTTLVAGAWWFEAFVVPSIATRAPGLLSTSPSPSVLIGAVATISLFAAGWTAVGVALLRARAVARPAAALLVVGGLSGLLALTTPWQIPFAMAIGWTGLTLRRSRRRESASPVASEVESEVPRRRPAVRG